MTKIGRPDWRHLLWLDCLAQVAPQRLPGKFGEETVLISPTEMLSREHAIAERLTIVFESMIARIADGEAPDLKPINQAALLLKELIADHHMADEERLIFPKIEASGRHADLLKTLRLQHDRGRAIVDRIVDLTRKESIEDVGRLNEIVNLCLSFAIMYRSHAATEETIVFPALYDFASNDEILNIEAIMRGEEKGLIENERFRTVLDSLTEIEARAGTADIRRFTPP